MRPLVLHGHSRPLTKIRFNHEGDLIFTASRNPCPVVFNAITGQRVGTYDSGTGVVWSIDVDFTTTRVAAGSPENMWIWDAETGEVIYQVPTSNSTRCCAFGYNGQQILYTTDSTMSISPKLCIADLRDPSQFTSPSKSSFFFEEKTEGRPLCILWGPLDRTFITGTRSGMLKKWDVRNPGEVLQKSTEHTNEIRDIGGYPDYSMFVTASKDCSAKLFDYETMEKLKTYQTDRPVNSAAISPLRDHVVLGGGQEAAEVTTTAQQSGKFEAQFFHTIFEEEFARVKGHFGPINTIAFHPDGRGYASGGEDGFVRVHRFDPKYFEFEA